MHLMIETVWNHTKWFDNQDKTGQEEVRDPGGQKEKQITTSKNHDKKCFTAVETSTKDEISAPNKPQTKSYLLSKMETMKQLNNALLEEVKNNEEAILIQEGKEKKYIEFITFLEETWKGRLPQNQMEILKPKPH